MGECKLEKRGDSQVKKPGRKSSGSNEGKKRMTRERGGRGKMIRNS